MEENLDSEGHSEEHKLRKQDPYRPSRAVCSEPERARALLAEGWSLPSPPLPSPALPPAAGCRRLRGRESAAEKSWAVGSVPCRPCVRREGSPVQRPRPPPTPSSLAHVLGSCTESARRSLAAPPGVTPRSPLLLQATAEELSALSGKGMATVSWALFQLRGAHGQDGESVRGAETLWGLPLCSRAPRLPHWEGTDRCRPQNLYSSPEWMPGVAVIRLLVPSPEAQGGGLTWPGASWVPGIPWGARQTRRQVTPSVGATQLAQRVVPSLEESEACCTVRHPAPLRVCGRAGAAHPPSRSP